MSKWTTQGNTENWTHYKPGVSQSRLVLLHIEILGGQDESRNWDLLPILVVGRLGPSEHKTDLGMGSDDSVASRDRDNVASAALQMKVQVTFGDVTEHEKTLGLILVADQRTESKLRRLLSHL